MLKLSAIHAVLAALAVESAAYSVFWSRCVRRAAATSGDQGPRALIHRIIGFATNALDTLGVGSFATTTSIYRFARLVPDELIPGTLNAGHTLPVMLQAMIYTSVVRVDTLTLVSMISSAVLGAWLGAGVVSRWPRFRIQVGMGVALILAATLMLLGAIGVLPAGGADLGVRGALLVLGVFGNAALGALMTLGIGLYAPCMVLVSLLGMDPKAAFPIMMCSSAFLMPVASARFIGAGSYHLGAATGLTIGGLPAVLLVAYLVRSLSLTTVRWLVIVVVLYTAIGLLRAAFARPRMSVPKLA